MKMVYLCIEIIKIFSKLVWIMAESCDMVCCLKGGLIMSLLKQLYNGDLYPAENIIPQTNEYRKLLHEMDGIGNRLEENMTTRQKDLLDEYLSAWSKSEKMIQEEVFRQAFVMGANLQREIQS